LDYPINGGTSISHFRYKNKYPVTITYGKHFLPQWLNIAKNIESKLELFEAMGKTYEKQQQEKRYDND